MQNHLSGTTIMLVARKSNFLTSLDFTVLNKPETVPIFCSHSDALTTNITSAFRCESYISS